MKIKPNVLYATASMVLVLFLIGLFAVGLLFANGELQNIRESMLFTMEMRDDATKAELDEVKRHLEESDFVKKGSIRYITKEEAAKEMQNDFGDVTEVLGINPLFNCFDFNLKSDMFKVTNKESKDGVQGLISTLKDFKGVRDVYYQEEMASEIEVTINRLAVTSLFVGIAFLLIALSLINNSVKLELYSNRFIIKNMQLVGASSSFISKPFILRGLLQGSIAGVLASLLIVSVLGLFLRNDFFVFLSDNPFELLLIFLGLVLMGSIISTWSAWRGVRGYLKKSVESLY